MDNFTRIVCPGNAFVYDNIVRSVFCKISYTDGKLTINGVHGPTRGGNALGSCGQIDLTELEFDSFDSGWSQQRVNMLASVWKRFHLNDLKAGSPAQEFYLQHNPINDRLNYFDRACEALQLAGLQPDPNYLHDGKPYRYGTAWINEEVPEWVLEWLFNLPETDRNYAWV